MEDKDIKILKELIQRYRDCGISDYPSMVLDFSLNLSEIQVMINILNELDRLQKENELAKETIKKHCSDMDNINNILAKLQKENEKLKFKERSKTIGEFGAIEIHDLINRTLSNDYIPKQVIKDKIEELKEEKYVFQSDDYDYIYNKGKYEVLKELLGE